MHSMTYGLLFTLPLGGSSAARGGISFPQKLFSDESQPRRLDRSPSYTKVVPSVCLGLTPCRGANMAGENSGWQRGSQSRSRPRQNQKLSRSLPNPALSHPLPPFLSAEDPASQVYVRNKERALQAGRHQERPSSDAWRQYDTGRVGQSPLAQR